MNPAHFFPTKEVDKMELYNQYWPQVEMQRSNFEAHLDLIESCDRKCLAANRSNDEKCYRQCFSMFKDANSMIDTEWKTYTQIGPPT